MKSPLLFAVIATAATLAAAQSADGEVRKVDKAQARLTLKHGEIKSLDMPPMTMAYRVKDPRQLESLAVGDRVKFDAEKINGEYVVTLIRKAP